MTIDIARQTVELRSSGAVVVSDVLVVADLHLGKERAFRQQGIPVPDGPGSAALARLGEEVWDTGVRGLLFLGDLFHNGDAIAGSTFEELDAWLRDRPALEVVLVRGNHDRIPPQLAEGLATVESLSIGDLALVHHPIDPAVPHLAGHLHPAVRIVDGPDSATLRCFWRRGDRLILPSYSSFTGASLIDPSPEDGVYVCFGDSVESVPIA